MSVTRPQVGELYVATFDRAPDSAGLDYWTTQEALLEIELIAQSFFDQPETQEMYPSTMSNEEYVNSIYNNVYNRDADDAGLIYWVSALNSGTLQRSDTIIALVNGAQGQDQNILDNKTEVGLYYAQFGAKLTLEQAFEVMSGVGSDSLSMATALDQIDKWVKDTVIPIPPAPRMELTTKIDSIEASDINSIIYGLVDANDAEQSTLNDADIIDGGGGKDTLKLEIKGATDPYIFIANMSNVEVFTLNNSASVDQTIDLTGTTGINSIDIIGAGTGAEISSVASIVDLNLNATVDSSTTITYDSAAVGSQEDTMYVYLNTTNAQTFKTNMIENLNIVTASGTQQLTVEDRELEKLVITGGGDLALTGSNSGGNATVIDGSVATGGLTINASVVDTNGATINSGLGNDTINGSAIIATKTLTIDSNAGNDTIDISLSIAKSINTVTAGAGDDTIKSGAGENSISGGTGVDKMTAGSGKDTFNFANSGDTGLTQADADTITSFATGMDKIDFDTLGSGTTNFDGAILADADFATAQTAANVALNGSINYSYRTDGANGYLFVDNNLDGTADEVVIFSGLGIDGVVAGDIMA